MAANPKTPTVQTIRAVALKAAELYGVTRKEVMATSGAYRSPVARRARWWAWSQLVAAGYGFGGIGRAWPCHHTSILHARDKGWGQTENAPTEAGARTFRWSTVSTVAP